MDTYGTDMTTARKYLGMFGLDGPRHLIKISDLSGGQKVIIFFFVLWCVIINILLYKARVVFASLSLQAPHILILDEPVRS